jgi:NitT/TauT family transport system substrate-binding protein
MYMKLFGRTLGAACVVAFAVAGGAASAQDLIRFMKVQPHPFVFLIADVGVAEGIFARHDLELDISGSSGDARLHQAMAAGEADIGLSSGTSLGFIERGSPVIGFMATHDAPLNMGIVITSNSPLAEPGRGIEDLHGRTIGVSSPAAMTYFLARRTAVEQGWSPDDIVTVSLGGLPAQVAAAEAGNIDGFVMSIDAGFQMETTNAGTVFLSFGDHIQDFHTHILLVSNDFRERNPDAVRRFATAWLEAVEHVLENPQSMVDVAESVINMDPEVARRSFELMSPAFSRTGRFDETALEVIAQGLVDTEILDSAPDMSRLYTHEYLPSAN